MAVNTSVSKRHTLSIDTTRLMDGIGFTVNTRSLLGGPMHPSADVGMTTKLSPSENKSVVTVFWDPDPTVMPLIRI